MGIPLAFFEKGSKVMVEALNFEKSLACKLRDIGIQPHSTLSIVEKPGNGGVIISIKGLKIAMDMMLAKKVMVIPV